MVLAVLVSRAARSQHKGEHTDTAPKAASPPGSAIGPRILRADPRTPRRCE